MSYLCMKIVKFVKSRLIFSILFLNACKQTFHILYVCISQNVKDVIMWNLWHIFVHVKTNIQADFQICISVPLIILFQSKIGAKQYSSETELESHNNSRYTNADLQIYQSENLPMSSSSHEKFVYRHSETIE